jgi:hypothetical protein
MVEVAGIEPASRNKPRAESTYLVVFDLELVTEDNQTVSRAAVPECRC